MIKKAIIGLILLVCICSGAFSVMSYYNPTNNSDMDNTDSNSIIGNTKENIKSIENNPVTNYIDNVDDILQYRYGYLLNDDNELIVFINHEIRHYLSNNSYYIESFYGLDYEYSHGYIRIVDGELRHYVNNNGGYYLESDGIPDTYTQCIECKGYIPLGNITKPVPSYLICHHDGCTGRIIPGDLNDLYTYDDLLSELGSGNYVPYEDAHLKFIRCDECGGFVDITQSNEIIEDYLCHHYNGTLNKSEIPKDKMLCYDEVCTILSKEGNIVWFWGGYNHWLEETNSLNENNPSIDTNIKETVTSADKNVIDDEVYREDNETYIDDFNQDFDNKETLDNYVDDYAPDNSVIIKVKEFVWWVGDNKSLNENNAPIDDTVSPIENNDFTSDNTVEDLSNNTI